MAYNETEQHPYDMNGVRLKVGSLVTWRSQARGSTTVKTGEVIYAGPAADGIGYIREMLPPGARMLFSTISDGLVVRVDGGPKARPFFYAPRLTQLKVVNPDAAA